MATIRRREGKNGVTYNVQIRIRPYPATNRSFKRLTDAKRWAEKTEMEMRQGRYGLINESRKRTLFEAIERYRKYILPRVVKSRREHIIDYWNSVLGHMVLRDITPAVITELRDRLTHEDVGGKLRAAATVVKYITTLSHILTICVNEWQWLESNPVSKVSKPSLPRGRTRFLDDEERERLLKACKESSNKLLYPIIVLGISCGLRRSEILNLEWKDLDFERGRVVLTQTKNGDVRVVPLVGLALDILRSLEVTRRIDTTLAFPSPSSNRPIDFRSAWRVAVKKAKLEDFKFHDLRHSFASYCVMNGSSLSEVGEILGHRNIQMSKRYSHLSEAYQKDVVSSMNEKIFG